MRDYDWVLLAEMDEAEALAPLVRLRIALVVSLGLISIAAGWVGWRYGRTVEDAIVQLQEASAHTRALLAAATDAVFEIDDHSTILVANEAAHRIFGWPDGELIGQNVTVIMPPAEREKYQAVLRRYLETGESRLIGNVVELTGYRRDGILVPCEVSLAAMTLPDGTRRFVGIHRDITVRKQAEERIRMFAQAMRTAMDGIILADPQAVIIETNPAFDRMFGYEPGELIGRLTSCLYPPTWQEKEFSSIVAATRETGWTGEVVGLRKGGTTFPRWVSTSSIRDPEGRLIGMLSVSRDLTEQKLVEEALHKSETKFRTLVETTKDWFWEINENAIYTYASPKIRELLGYAPEEVIGRTPFDLMPPDEATRVAGLFSPIMAAREPFTLLENINLHTDGHKVVLETNGTPIFDSQGVFRGYHGTDRDITARKRVENEIREARQKYLALIDSIDGIVCEVDAQTYQFSFVSKRAEPLLGYPVAQWLAEPTFWQDHLHSEDRDWAVAFCSQATAEKRDHQFEYRMLAADGRIVWFRDLVTVVVVHDRPVKLQALMLDITERKRSEEELKQRLEELERFQKATIQREFRIKELKDEVERLKKSGER